MGLALVTAPTALPITLPDGKQHLNADCDDLLIDALIRAATEKVQVDLGDAQLVTATWRLYLDEFPCWTLTMPKPPLQSITSIKYLDEAGVQQTLSSSKYKVDAVSVPGRVEPAWGEEWPATRREANAVEIVFVAGYGAPTSVPRSIQAAIKLLLGNLYMNREATISGTIIAEVPLAYESLIIANRTGIYH